MTQSVIVSVGEWVNDFVGRMVCRSVGVWMGRSVCRVVGRSVSQRLSQFLTHWVITWPVSQSRPLNIELFRKWKTSRRSVFSAEDCFKEMINAAVTHTRWSAMKRDGIREPAAMVTVKWTHAR